MGIFRDFGESMCDEGERLAYHTPSSAPGISSETWRPGSRGSRRFVLRLNGIDPDMPAQQALNSAPPGIPRIPKAILENLPESIQQMYQESLEEFSRSEKSIDFIPEQQS